MQAFEKQTGNQLPGLMKEKPKIDFFFFFKWQNSQKYSFQLIGYSPFTSAFVFKYLRIFVHFLQNQNSLIEASRLAQTTFVGGEKKMDDA